MQIPRHLCILAHHLPHPDHHTQSYHHLRHVLYSSRYNGITIHYNTLYLGGVSLCLVSVVAGVA
jgi:hypothetical protein